ncbi:MAG: endopeptidase La [Proteobacteria bacterium]|nr:endopeptidase La [Pseudomonadota bacterium]
MSDTSLMPMLPVRDVVVFPYMILPLFVGRESSIKAVEDAISGNRMIFLAAQKEITDEFPAPDRIYDVGTIATIVRMKKLADGRVKILIQGVNKGRITSFEQKEPYYKVSVTPIEEGKSEINAMELDALMRNVKEQLEKLISMGKMLSPDLILVLEEIKDPGKFADIIAANMGLKIIEAQEVLEIADPVKRLYKVNDYVLREVEILNIQVKINNLAKDEITKSQKEYYLKEQMKAIKSELGEFDSKMDDTSDLRQRLMEIEMPNEVKEEAMKQLERLERMHPDSSESAVLRTYLDWVVDVPWSKKTEDNMNLKRAKQILDEDHYDLEEVKERIVEYLAVGKLNKKIKGPILCFIGAPGVGKTSLGKSIARALGRQFVRISLGGVKDEAEIRGHRRTYVGAMPGKIIQGLKLAGTCNPVFVLDEIDKLGADFKGDPSSALLEVLDPEQNFSFRDHYLNVPYDLSNVLFIATANFMDTIPPALKDRMEIIQLAGYTAEEKIKIAQIHLVPKQKKENGLENVNLKFSDKVILKIITEYTREAGVRNLERNIGKVFRKIAKIIADGKTISKSISSGMIEKHLGCPPFKQEEKNQKDEIGVCTGLAWTQFGGEILMVEVASSKGSGLKLTGNLGEVMKESAMTALSYVKTMAAHYGIDEDYFQNHEIHVHFPQGAIPKDGPSAGVTIATAIISYITGRPVSRDIAMTGEISLTGKVLQIGGLKEKALAAMRACIKTIIVPAENKKELINIPKEYRKKLNFVFVGKVEEAIQAALLPAKKVEHLDSYRHPRKPLKAVA